MCFIQMCMGMLPRSNNRCRTIATFVLFFANVIFLFAGLTLVGLGLIFLLLQKTVLKILPFHAISLFAVPVIAIGALVYVIAVLGFTSAWKQWRSLLIPYVIFVAILLIAKGCVVVATWNSIGDVKMVTYQWVTDAFRDPAHGYSFHLLEMSMKCCGSYDAFSYHELDLEIPYTCCDMPALAGVVESCDVAHAFQGCSFVISDILQVIADVADGTLFGAIAVEIIALISSVYLLRTADAENPQLRYTIVPSNLDPDHTHVEMAEMQLVTSQPGPQIVYEPCEMLI